jgi:hypothetical protein
MDELDTLMRDALGHISQELTPKGRPRSTDDYGELIGMMDHFAAGLPDEAGVAAVHRADPAWWNHRFGTIPPAIIARRLRDARRAASERGELIQPELPAPSSNVR